MNALLALVEPYPWVIPAACDAVAFLALAAIALAVRRPASTGPTASVLPMQPAQPAAPAATPEPESRGDAVAPESLRPLRSRAAPPRPRLDVNRALDAIGKWEESYGSPRGIQELARMVGQGHGRKNPYQP